MADEKNDETLPFSATDVTHEVAIRMGKSGRAAETPNTITDQWEKVCRLHGDRASLHQKINGEWKTWTWNEYYAEVQSFGKSLISLGFERFDVVNILGFNSPEWLMANFGAIEAGGIACGIYATNNPEACHYVSEHSNAKFVVVDGLKQLEKYYEIAKDLPNLKALIMYGQDKLPADIKDKLSIPVYTFEEFQKLGKEVSDDDLKARSSAWKPGQTCSLIYTSGTTGPPKGVMITQDNVTWTSRNTMSITKNSQNSPDDVMVSYLPLSHIAAQMLDMYLPLESGLQIYFAQPDALKGTLVETLKEARPTMFFGVPRVWEKMYDKLQEVARANTGIKKVLSTWAKKQAEAHWRSQEFGSTTKDPKVNYFLAKKLLKKAHVALGLDRCYEFRVSAAPIEEKILRYFTSIDIVILELFGQSECTGPAFVNQFHAFKIGTVGRPLYGTESRLGEGGELQYRGRHIFAGYKGMDEETKKTIDPEGWMCSGDIVKFDNDHVEDMPKPSGFVTITGRIKELIITAGGENIPPVMIEDNLKEVMPAISNAMVIGDKRKFLTVLITLHVEIDEEGVPTDKLTGSALEVGKEIGSAAQTSSEARDDEKWQNYITEGIKKANTKATSNAQKVQKFYLVDGDFSEKGTELTPTLKLRRKVTAAKYDEHIEALYA